MKNVRYVYVCVSVLLYSRIFFGEPETGRKCGWNSGGFVRNLSLDSEKEMGSLCSSMVPLRKWGLERNGLRIRILVPEVQGTCQV